MKHKIRIITLLGCIFEPKQCFLRSYGKFNGIPAISYTFGCYLDYRHLKTVSNVIASIDIR